MSLYSKQSGFTLIEMMIVIGLLSVLAGIAVPNFLSYLPKHRLNGAARQVMGDLMRARMQAVSQNNEFKVFFDLSSNNHEYKILDDDNNDGNIDVDEWIQIKDIQSEYFDVTFSNVTADPIFHPRGTASGATITLSNPAVSTDVNVAIAMTGRVKIE